MKTSLLPSHAALVHFPIAWIFLGTLASVAWWTIRDKRFLWWLTGFWILASVSTVLALWSGEKVEDDAEHLPVAEQLLEEHEEAAELTRNLVLILTANIIIASILRQRFTKASDVLVGIHGLLAIFATLSVLKTGRVGGEMVYQHGVGVQSSQSGKVSGQNDKSKATYKNDDDD